MACRRRERSQAPGRHGQAQVTAESIPPEETDDGTIKADLAHIVLETNTRASCGGDRPGDGPTGDEVPYRW